MFSQYFGNYLLNKGWITSDQLKDALDIQKSTHVKLGVLAVNEGYMTGTEVEIVHEKQKQVDKRFGEIAIDMNLLTNEQLEKLLSTQKHNHLLLGQALVDRNYMSIDEFSQALEDYKKENSLTDDQFESIKKGNIEEVVKRLSGIDQLNNKHIYTDYLSLFAKNVIRFIDDQIYLEAIPIKDTHQSQWLVSQHITGETPLFTSLAANEEMFLKLASIYAEEQLTTLDELAKASVAEFLNLHNGIFLVNMSNNGTELNMKPQTVEKNVVIEHDSSCYLILIHLSNGCFEMLISDQPDKITIKPATISTTN